MTRDRISTGSPFEEAFGYSRAVVQGDWCFVAGTTGYDYAAMTLPEGAAEQTENCLATIARSLEQAGFSMKDVVRARYYVSDIAHWEAATPVVKRWMDEARPAATLVKAELLDPSMKIEIEVTALRDG
jgi:enamine deaminase RidA (YjgF/YER057c/UK114 family)